MTIRDKSGAATSDLVLLRCPNGHEFRVSEYVWTVFVWHGCSECDWSYPSWELTQDSASGSTATASEDENGEVYQ